MSAAEPGCGAAQVSGRGLNVEAQDRGGGVYWFPSTKRYNLAFLWIKSNIPLHTILSTASSSVPLSLEQRWVIANLEVII